MWVRVFNLHFFDKMKSCRHKRRGCKFSHVGASFPMWVRVSNLHFLDTMKILSPQEMPASDPQLVPNERR